MKRIIIASTILLGISTQASASPRVYHRDTVIEDRVCRTVPARQSGYIKWGDGRTVRLTTPEHKKCSYVPSTRIRSRSYYSD